MMVVPMLDETASMPLTSPSVSCWKTAIGIVLVCACVCPPVSAQTSLERLEFRFANPGARSMGFGGAFVALADDPTAAFANPGGLVQLTSPEAFLDLRLGFESDDDSGTFSFDEGSTDVTNLAFVSFVYPVSRCSVAAYGHQMVKADISNLGDLPEEVALQDLAITRYAVAGACRLLERLSFGMGVSYFDATFRAVGTTERSADWGLNAGVLWRPWDRLSLGGFFREGPRLEIAGGSQGSLALPDAYGLGAALRSKNGRFTVSVEWDRVAWSTMFEGVGAVSSDNPPNELVDVDEFHLGFEYAWRTSTKVLALRFGAWREPDHVADRSGGEEDRTRVHGAVGFGMAWEHFQLDMATDFSNDVFTLGVSGMYIF